MQTANQNLFNAAHQIARETRNAFATYRDAFAAALRQLWTEAKEAEKAAKEAEKAAKKAVYSRPRVIKAAREIRTILIAKGATPETEKQIQWVLIIHPLNATEREAARELAAISY